MTLTRTRSRAPANDIGAIVGMATYTKQSPADPIAAGSHGVLLAPFVVTQSNYPVASTADASTDSGSTTISKTIVGPGATDGFALITGAPGMPQLTAQIMGFGSSSGLTVDWRAEVTSDRPSVRSTADNVDFPVAAGEGGAGGPGVIDNEPISTAWNMAADYPTAEPDDFFRGNVTVYFRIKKADGTYLSSAEQSFTFKSED